MVKIYQQTNTHHTGQDFSSDFDPDPILSPPSQILKTLNNSLL